MCIMMSINSVTEVVHKVGPNSEVSIANSYGRDGPCIEYREERGFPHPSRAALGTTQPPIKLIMVFLLGGEASEA